MGIKVAETGCVGFSPGLGHGFGNKAGAVFAALKYIIDPHQGSRCGFLNFLNQMGGTGKRTNRFKVGLKVSEIGFQVFGLIERREVQGDETGIRC